MDLALLIFLVGLAAIAVLAVALFMVADHADQAMEHIAIQHRLQSAVLRPAWWCLGPCESEWTGERPADGYCPICRQRLQEAGVLE